jgi:putative transposase
MGEGFCATRAHQGGVAERKAVIDRDHKLAITRQTRLRDAQLGDRLLPAPAGGPVDQALMRKLDELHLEHPFMGPRTLRDQLSCKALAQEGVTSERSCLASESMHLHPSLAPAKPRPATRSTRTCCASSRSPARTKPERWRRPTFPWHALSSTSTPSWMAATRRVLAHKMAITLEASHAKEVIEHAFTQYGVPRSSIWAKGASARQWNLPMWSWPAAASSPWTGAALGATTSSWGAFGAA